MFSISLLFVYCDINEISFHTPAVSISFVIVPVRAPPQKSPTHTELNPSLFI